MADSTQQFGRVCTLIVSGKTLAGLDLSQFRIKFSVKRSGVMTPNVAEITVYNLDLGTAALIKKEFTTVTLQAGYQGNFGVIFKGNIKQFISGRETPTDTFLTMVAGDGDQAYNFSVVNQTIAAGSSQADHLNAAFTALGKNGVSKGYVGTLPATKLPRGKVMYGNARDYIRNIAESTGAAWSIQDQQAVFLPLSSYLPGEAVVLTSKTGMTGTPQQTVMGVNCTALLNPRLKIHGRAKIDNASVAAYKIDYSVPGSPANTPVPLSNDGYYYIYNAEHTGDTRGAPWSTSLVLISQNVGFNPLNNGGVSTS